VREDHLELNNRK